MTYDGRVLDEFENRVLQEIAEHGWFGLVVEDVEHRLLFEYTVGLVATHNHPEIIIFGLPQDTSHQILWSIIRKIETGRDFRESQRYEDVLERFAFATKPVHPSMHVDYLGYAMWHRRMSSSAADLQAVQLFWPDKEGLFPWETGCDRIAILLQPDLSIPQGN